MYALYNNGIIGSNYRNRECVLWIFFKRRVAICASSLSFIHSFKENSIQKLIPIKSFIYFCFQQNYFNATPLKILKHIDIQLSIYLYYFFFLWVCLRPSAFSIVYEIGACKNKNKFHERSTFDWMSLKCIACVSWHKIKEE